MGRRQDGTQWREETGVGVAVVGSRESGRSGLRLALRVVGAESPSPPILRKERGSADADPAHSRRALLGVRLRALRRALDQEEWDVVTAECAEVYGLLLADGRPAPGLVGWLGLASAVAHLERGAGDRFRAKLAHVLRHVRRHPRTSCAPTTLAIAAAYRRARRATAHLAPVGPAGTARARGWPMLIARSAIGGFGRAEAESPDGAQIPDVHAWVTRLAEARRSLSAADLVAVAAVVAAEVGELTSRERELVEASFDAAAAEARSAWGRAACHLALAELRIWRIEPGVPGARRAVERARADLWQAAASFHRLGLEPTARHAEERAWQLSAMGTSVPESERRRETAASVANAPTVSPAGSRPAGVCLREVQRRAAAHGFVTSDRRTLEALARVLLLAPSPLPILIQGESGTGKDLVARAIHAWSGLPGQFLAIHCGAIPRDLLESELFGHARGAFTGAAGEKPGLIELAHQGTLFLDEIGEMSAEAQMKMLRVLESGEIRRVGDVRTRHVRVRIVAATHRDLVALVASGGFRLDLLHRIGSALVRIPPLRERRGDIPLLARTAVAEVDSGRVLDDSALATILSHPWPGNVRELLSSLRHAAYLARGLGRVRIGEDLLAHSRGVSAAMADPRTIDPHADDPASGFLREQALPLALGSSPPEPLPADTVELGEGGLDEVLEALERRLIVRALEENGWNRTHAARKLGGMSRTTLIGKMRRLRIESPDGSGEGGD